MIIIQNRVRARRGKRAKWAITQLWKETSTTKKFNHSAKKKLQNWKLHKADIVYSVFIAHHSVINFIFPVLIYWIFLSLFFYFYWLHFDEKCSWRKIIAKNFFFLLFFCFSSPRSQFIYFSRLILTFHYSNKMDLRDICEWSEKIFFIIFFPAIFCFLLINSDWYWFTFIFYFRTIQRGKL
jgi:hypothetical protein